MPDDPKTMLAEALNAEAEALVSQIYDIVTAGKRTDLTLGAAIAALADVAAMVLAQDNLAPEASITYFLNRLTNLYHQLRNPDDPDE